MKKFLLTLALCLPFLAPAFAQEAKPVVKELRAIMEESPTGFASYKGELLQKDESSGAAFYNSSHTPEVSIAGHVLVENPADKLSFYMIRYNTKDMDAMTLRLMMIMAQQYLDEMNAMVKSGKYVGRDYKMDNGMDVTEIKDKEGRMILDYRSDSDNQMLIVYSTKGK